MIVKYYIEKYCCTHPPENCRLETGGASEAGETDGVFVHSLMRNKDHQGFAQSSCEHTQLHMQSVVYSKDSRLTAQNQNLLMSLSKDADQDPLA